MHALKGLACRVRVTPASSPASHCKQCSALTSPSLHARAGVTKNLIMVLMGPKVRHPTVVPRTWHCQSVLRVASCIMHERVDVPTHRLLGDWSKMNPGWSHFDESEWECIPVVDSLTQQPNTYDCGVYTCWYAECVLFGKVCMRITAASPPTPHCTFLIVCDACHRRYLQARTMTKPFRHTESK